mmetsp:Transcript_21437/g.52753  ORF Transcript_21437/g.52753 Transcript_21437/m.52753 type:complete len:231 (+) Transcript_21437:139-831(+)
MQNHSDNSNAFSFVPSHHNKLAHPAPMPRAHVSAPGLPSFLPKPLAQSFAEFYMVPYDLGGYSKNTPNTPKLDQVVPTDPVTPPLPFGPPPFGRTTTPSAPPTVPTVPGTPAEESGCHTCSHCPTATFAAKAELEKHVYLHHKMNRPHACNQCGSSFTRKSDLNKHCRMVHEKLKPHKCFLCATSFGQKGDLTKHMRGVHAKLKRREASRSPTPGQEAGRNVLSIASLCE